MQGSLSATSAEITWVLTSYIVAAAIMTAAGRLAVVPLRRGVTCSLASLGSPSSMLCGAAQSLTQMVVFRIAAGHVRRSVGAAVAVHHDGASTRSSSAARRWRSGASA